MKTTTTIEPFTKRPAFRALETHYEKASQWHLRKLFAADPKRGERYTTEAAGLYLAAMGERTVHKGGVGVGDDLRQVEEDAVQVLVRVEEVA